MTTEYTFKLKPGATLQWRRKDPLSNKWPIEPLSLLTLEGEVIDSTSCISGVSLNGATTSYDDFEVEVTVKATRKFKPGYYRNRAAGGNGRPRSVMWYTTPPADIKGMANWERVEVKPSALDGR